MKNMTLRRFILVVATLFATMTMHAQTADYRIVEDNYGSLQVVLTTDGVAMEKVTLDGQQFTALSVEGLIAPSNDGCPSLPLFSHLIEVPLCQGYEVTVSDMQFDTMQVVGRVVPVQPSRSKSDTQHYPLTIKSKVNSTDAFYGNIGAEVQAVGIARYRQ